MPERIEQSSSQMQETCSFYRQKAFEFGFTEIATQGLLSAIMQPMGLREAFERKANALHLTGEKREAFLAGIPVSIDAADVFEDIVQFAAERQIQLKNEMSNAQAKTEVQALLKTGQHAEVEQLARCQFNIEKLEEK